MRTEIIKENGIEILLIKENKELTSDIYDLLNYYTHIKFDDYFNKRTDLSIFNNIISIKFGHNFNSNVILPNLTHLYFGESFNSFLDLTKLNKLIYLSFEGGFNQELDFSNCLNLKFLKLGANFNKPLDLLKNINLTHLVIGDNFNQSLDKLAPYIEILKINSGRYFPAIYTHNLNNLSDTIKELWLPQIFLQEIYKLPIRIRKIKIGKGLQSINYPYDTNILTLSRVNNRIIKGLCFDKNIIIEEYFNCKNDNDCDY